MSKSSVKFASVRFDAIDPKKTLPAKFARLLAEAPIKQMVNGKTVCIKMHLGANLGYTTIPPLFTKILIDKIKEFGGDVFITDIFAQSSNDFGARNTKTPDKALSFSGKKYLDFQGGTAISATEVLKTFELSNVYHINVLTNITILCDCWGMSTPSLVPDLGILSSDDLVALDKASLDMIKVKDIL